MLPSSPPWLHIDRAKMEPIKWEFRLISVLIIQNYDSPKNNGQSFIWLGWKHWKMLIILLLISPSWNLIMLRQAKKHLTKRERGTAREREGRGEESREWRTKNWFLKVKTYYTHNMYILCYCGELWYTGINSFGRSSEVGQGYETIQCW